MSRDRVQKILARAGLASRRQAEQLIREGRVTVNGRIATLGEQADPAEDAIKLDGKRVRVPVTFRYLLLNKPPGFLCTRHDPEGRSTVMELVPERRRSGLVPVGRLDYQSEGLILLTDDGDWAQRIAHPRYGCDKLYLAKVRGVPAEDQLERLQRGLVIDGSRTAPCKIRPHRKTQGPRTAKNNSWWEVRLREGRNRQIREMFQRIGHPVMRLRRVAIGPLRDPSLKLGSWRELSEAEVERMREGNASAGGQTGHRRAAGAKKARPPRPPKRKGGGKGRARS